MIEIERKFLVTSEAFKKEAPLEEVLAKATYGEDLFYHALHFLAIRRVIVFDEARMVRNLDEHVNRLKSMYQALQGKNPIEIFKYFGLKKVIETQIPFKFEYIFNLRYSFLSIRLYLKGFPAILKSSFQLNSPALMRSFTSLARLMNDK